MRYLRASLAILAVSFPLYGGASAAVTGDSAATELRAVLWSADPLRQPAGGSYLQSFYAQQNYGLAWWRDGNWSPAARAMVKALAAADRQGLDPADYQPQRLSATLDEARDARAVAAADMMLSAAALRYVNDLANGRIDPGAVGWNIWYVPHGDPATLLADALRSGRIDASLAAAGPQTAAYRDLLDLRDRYARLAALPWPQLPDGPSLALGDAGPRVTVLREQLAIVGDLPDPAAPSALLSDTNRQARTGEGARSPYYIPVSAGGWREAPQDAPPVHGRRAVSDRYDGDVEAAVRRFQRRHGLDTDGVVGPATRAALNVSPRQRLNQIEVNLERLRWMPADLGDRYILVNIPAFQLTAFAHGQAALRMPVVVGEPDWQTPVLSDQIINLKFAPTWTIPPSIVRKETLAHIRRDPGYLSRKSIRVFRDGYEISPYDLNLSAVAAGSGYVFRQDSGPRNALGQIRFSLTNPQDIYLHDTPAQRAFGEADRAISHGCIRVAEPVDLAMFVLDGDPAWDRERVRQRMNAGDTNFHELDRPVPVHLVYFTAWVDENGVAQFRDDIYGRDEALTAALARRPAWAPPAI